MEVRKPANISPAFANMRGQPQALIVLPSPMLWYHSEKLAGLAFEYRLPATSMADFFANSGGAVSYDPQSTLKDGRNAVLVAKYLTAPTPVRSR